MRNTLATVRWTQAQLAPLHPQSKHSREWNQVRPVQSQSMQSRIRIQSNLVQPSNAPYSSSSTVYKRDRETAKAC